MIEACQYILNKLLQNINFDQMRYYTVSTFIKLVLPDTPLM